MTPQAVLSIVCVVLAALLSGTVAGFGWAVKRQVEHNATVRLLLSQVASDVRVLQTGGSDRAREVADDLETLEGRHNLLATAEATLAERFNSHERWHNELIAQRGAAT